MGDAGQFEDMFYGAVKMGERGQVVIPAEARRRLDMAPGERLLVFGHPFGKGIVLVKVDAVHDLLTRMSDWLSQLREEAAHNGANQADVE